MNSRQVEFTWKIPNFSMLPHQNGTCLKSPYFTVETLSGKDTHWCLWLYPRGETTGYENSVTCFVERKADDNQDPIKNQFSISFESAFSEVRTASYEFMPGNTLGLHTFLSFEKLNKHRQFIIPLDILTIRCLMLIDNPGANEMKDNLEVEKQFPKKIATISQIEVDKRCATWKITKIMDRINRKIKISFDVNSSLEDAPNFKLLFHFGEDSNSEYVQIEITQTKQFPNKASHFVKCKLTVISEHKDNQLSHEDTFLFTSKGKEKWNFPEFIKISYLSEDSYVHLDDTLYLLCEFSYTCKTKISHREIPIYCQETFQNPKDLHMSHLTNTIQKLYLSKKFCDVNLQVGEQNFPAQKLVLCAQSPVFCAMFENDMKEKNTNLVEIDDVEIETLKLMLKFLHSNVMEEGLQFEEILKLYSAADKYQIALLKHRCAILLLSLLSVDNVSEVLIMADRHHDDFLLAFVHNFLKIHAVEIFSSSKWEQFFDEDPKLFGSVMIKVLKSS